MNCHGQLFTVLTILHPLSMQTILIDDADLSFLDYTGQWTPSGSVNEYNSTTHGSSTKNSAVSFSFRGNSIQVYGTIGPSSSDGSPQTTYTLDSMPPVIYIASHNPDSAIYRQPFYTSPNITDAEHNLTVTVNGGGTLWLDYFLFTQTFDDTSEGPVKVQSNTSTSLSSDSTTTSVESSSTSQFPSTTITAVSAQISSSSTTLPGVDPSTGTIPVTMLPTSAGSIHTAPFPAAAFVGAIIGTLVFLATLGFAAWYFISRRRRGPRVDPFSLHKPDGPVYGQPPLRQLILPQGALRTGSTYSKAPSDSPTGTIHIRPMSDYAVVGTPTSYDPYHAHRAPPSRGRNGRCAATLQPDYEQQTLLSRQTSGIRTSDGTLQEDTDIDISTSSDYDETEAPPAYSPKELTPYRTS